MQRVIHNGLVYYTFDGWPSLTHGIFTRKGGVSGAPFASLNVGGTVDDDPAAVLRNHELMYGALTLDRRRACTVWLAHSTETVVINDAAAEVMAERGWVARADGMVTDQPGRPLTMRYADCTPILFYDPVRGVIGIAHAGWQGTVRGAGVSVVRAMQKTYGCHPVDIQAGIGPSIGPERYQVGEEVVAEVRRHFGESSSALIARDSTDGTAYLDLWAANALDLRRAGVEQIEIAGICTAENTDEFYSHRAENGRTGRFGVVLAL